jgi:peptide deformylase
MAIRKILRYPDSKLSAVSEPVSEFNDALVELVQDLTDTMRAAPGLGITANHIGILQRVFVLELTPGTVDAYINPQITWSSPELSRHSEGSVSMPGASDDVERPVRIKLAFQDVTGNHHTLETDGFLSTCIQHEIDQLDGIFWIKRLSRLKRDRLIRKWEKQSD